MSLSSPLICCTPPDSSSPLEESTHTSSSSEDVPLDGNLNIKFLETAQPLKSKERGNPSSSVGKSKKVFCYYCETEVQNFPRHLTRNHASELDVQKMLSLPAVSKERKNLLFSLRKKGNYLKNNSDISKPVRKGNDDTNYLPCVHCLGYYSSRNLWRHRKNCAANPNKGGSAKNSKTEAQNFLIRNIKVDSHLRDVVFPRMRADRISFMAKKDALICAFGARYLRIHREAHFILVASRKMRELSRILLEVQKIKPYITSYTRLSNLFIMTL